MIFKIKWGDLKNDFIKKVMVSNPGEETPIKYYYEDDLNLYAFLTKQGITECSIIPKETLENIEDFKKEMFIGQAKELMENPLIKHGNLTLRY